MGQRKNYVQHGMLFTCMTCYSRRVVWLNDNEPDSRNWRFKCDDCGTEAQSIGPMPGRVWQSGADNRKDYSNNPWYKPSLDFQEKKALEKKRLEALKKKGEQD